MNKQNARSPKREAFVGVFDSMEDGVCVISQDYDIEYINAALQAQFGDFDGRKCYAYFYDRTEPCPWCDNNEVWAGKAGRSERHFEKTGRTYDLIATPLHNADGTVSKLGIYRDVSEHKLAAQAARESEDRYRALFDTMAEGFALHEIICDENGTPCDYRFLDVNPAFENLMGMRRDKVIGRTATEVLPDLEPGWVETYGKVALTGESVQLERYSPQLDKYFEVFAFRPAENQFATLLVDITEFKLSEKISLKALEETRRRQAEVAALLRGSRTILESRDFPHAAQAIFGYCKDLIGAVAGYVALLSKDGSENELVFLDSGGMPCSVDPSLPMPIRGLRGEVYASGKAAYDNHFSTSKWMTYMPDGHTRLENVLFAPLTIEGKVVGLLGLGNKPGGFTDDDARIATAFGELAAVALLNSRTLQSLEDSEERFRSVAETAADAIICADSKGHITLWNLGAEAMFGYSSKDVTGKPLTVIIPERFAERHRDGMRRVVETGKSGLVGKTTELTARRINGSEFPVELSLAVWKMRGEVYFTGIIRDITERRQAQLILHNEYEREKTIAETLQRSFLSPVDLEIEGFSFSDRYQAALHEAQVGGDFYDVFSLRDGHIAIVVGDVSGKGLNAALHTAMAKHMLRAFANESSEPAEILERLNRAMCDYSAEETFVTIVFGVLHPEARSLVYANAGHDHPVLYRRALGRSLLLDVTGHPIGLYRECRYGQQSVELALGDVLLIYTDGITEAGVGGQFFGPEGLLDVLMANVDESADVIADAVLDSATKFAGGHLRDDAALLVIKAETT